MSCTAALFAAAAVQLGALGVHITERARQLPIELELLCAARPPAAPNPAMLAFRDLRRAVAPYPENTRTLLVTQVLDPVQYEFYLWPRPLRFLQQLDDATVEVTERVAPQHAHLMHDRLRTLEHRGTRMTPDSLTEALAWAECLLVFGPLPSLLAPRLQDWQAVQTLESTTVYRRL